MLHRSPMVHQREEEDKFIFKKTMAISCYRHVFAFHADTVVISYMRDCWTSGKATLNLTMSWSFKYLDEAGWLSKKPGTTCSSQLLSSHWARDPDSVACRLPCLLSCCRQSPNWYNAITTYRASELHPGTPRFVLKMLGHSGIEFLIGTYWRSL